MGLLDFMELSPWAVEVLGQLFVQGPTWDGNVSSKLGRDELVDRGFAEKGDGWAWLTRSGVTMAAEAPVGNRYDGSWYQKQHR